MVEVNAPPVRTKSPPTRIFEEPTPLPTNVPALTVKLTAVMITAVLWLTVPAPVFMAQELIEMSDVSVQVVLDIPPNTTSSAAPGIAPQDQFAVEALKFAAPAAFQVQVAASARPESKKATKKTTRATPTPTPRVRCRPRRDRRRRNRLGDKSRRASRAPEPTVDSGDPGPAGSLATLQPWLAWTCASTGTRAGTGTGTWAGTGTGTSAAGDSSAADGHPLDSASAVPPNAPRLMRPPLGTGSAEKSSAGSPWSVDGCRGTR